MKVQQVIDIIESVFPLRRQEAWDNSGLQIGNREADVAKVLLCTDVTDKVMQEAIDKNCGLIVSHHPLLFHGLKTIEGATREQRCTIQAVRHDIAVYSSHTAADCCLHGISGRMAEKLGIDDYDFLVPTGVDSGLGVIGNLSQATGFFAFLDKVKSAFNVPVIKYTAPVHNKVQRIAFCGGAGSEFIGQAIDAHADVYITADVKYHEFQVADFRIALLDIGHFESEQHIKELMQNLLHTALPALEILQAETDCSPVLTY